jgi:N-acetylglucosaminyl-diphospho-decaprenol L-rhamnosyltransferase
VTIHVIIPVFNRLALTQRVLACLRRQKADEPLRLIVVDDGSTDGTSDYLASQSDITVLHGNGSLWWGGAVDAGLKQALKEGTSLDWALLINNDTQFGNDFVQRLLEAARSYAPAAVGSVICDEAVPERLLSIGPVYDAWRLKITDKLQVERLRESGKKPHSVSALSGRGTLYPLSAFSIVGTMKPFLLPHYLADYELAVRVSAAGFKLLVSEDAAVLSANEFGNAYRPASLIDKFLRIRSPYYLPAVVVFWWRANGAFGRVTLLARLIYLMFKSRRPNDA